MARKLLTASARGRDAAKKIAAAEKYLSTPGAPYGMPAPYGNQNNINVGAAADGRPYKSRAAHVLLWLFFGWAGAHNFYIGRYLRGTIELLYGPLMIVLGITGVIAASINETVINNAKAGEETLSLNPDVLGGTLGIISLVLIVIYPILMLYDVIFINTDGEGRPLT